KIGCGMTARTTAHLTANNDDGFRAMIERRGVDLAKQFYQSQSAAITRIETIQEAERIDCDFRRVDGFLFPGPQTEQSELEEERKACEQAGMPVKAVVGLPRGTLADALYWDMLDPYHYVRLQPGKDSDTLIVGGEDHKSGKADDAEIRYEALEAWIRNLVPSLGGVTHRWSGQVLETIDYS